MTPISKIDAVLGPPNPSTSKLINELEEYEDVSPEDRSEIIVLFISEDNISKSPQVDIPIEDSRKYTAFLFDSTVYQFKRVPYGFRNSLPAFVRALKLALGGGTSEYVVFYIDDILIHSKTFEENSRRTGHSNKVLSDPTSGK
jgi:hypothetical protein